jgi:hypothetical protein
MSEMEDHVKSEYKDVYKKEPECMNRLRFIYQSF